MYNCLRFAGLTTLLIGLQMLAPKLIDAQGKHNPLQRSFQNLSNVASPSNSSQDLEQTTLSNTNNDFDPPDNGGPDNTRGSGTR